MKNSIKGIIVLVCICAVVAVLLALTNSITGPIIKENEDKKANQALLEVLPDGGNFEKVDLSAYTLPSTVSEVYRAENGGYAIKLITKGYAPNMTIICGIDANGVVTGSKYLSGGETNKAELVMNDRVPGATLDTVDSVDTVTSPTAPLTTGGYLSAIKDALNAAIILGGGEVDLRTEEEILNDNLSAALPEANGKFTKHFFVEVVEGIDAIYVADNNTGTVLVIGEKFIAVDASGNLLTECSESDGETVKAAIATVSSTAFIDLDLTKYEGLPSQLVSARRTSTGNYVIEIKAAGYGITGGNEYHPASGEYIHVMVSITNGGKIIDCYTVSQKETDGLGSACADEKFYGQFDGKTEENFNNIDAIAGATMTTDGYKKAIERAFNCVKIFEGGLEG